VCVISTVQKQVVNYEIREKGEDGYIRGGYGYRPVNVKGLFPFCLGDGVGNVAVLVQGLETLVKPFEQLRPDDVP